MGPKGHYEMEFLEGLRQSRAICRNLTHEHCQHEKSECFQKRPAEGFCVKQCSLRDPVVEEPAATSPAVPWGIPERIYVLNLDTQPERMAAFRASLATSKILAGVPLVRWRATPPDEMIIPDWWRREYTNRFHQGTIWGTGRDQQSMIETAYRDGLCTVLIFEDDARLSPEFDQVYAAASAELPPTFMGLWLTGTHPNPPIPFSPHLNRCTGRLQTAAYLLSRRGMHRVYSHLVHQKFMICDQATKQLHQMEPHFYEPATPSMPVTPVHWRDGKK